MKLPRPSPTADAAPPSHSRPHWPMRIAAAGLCLAAASAVAQNGAGIHVPLFVNSELTENCRNARSNWTPSGPPSTTPSFSNS